MARQRSLKKGREGSSLLASEEEEEEEEKEEERAAGEVGPKPSLQGRFHQTGRARVWVAVCSSRGLCRSPGSGLFRRIASSSRL
ncbi:hypothetical protein B296_00037372 [Ensete ventricosum]|uniref:Uncharacterized protein n=1 Tax=Ensete ventricosum TaxID=4639 RepID=A0A426ZZQ3_ENSVE|nr:hypothetical protein B296_00037372 [Ensete ventricosum]